MVLRRGIAIILTTVVVLSLVPCPPTVVAFLLLAIRSCKWSLKFLFFLLSFLSIIIHSNKSGVRNSRGKKQRETQNWGKTGATTLSTTTLSITTLSIMTLSIMTLSIMTLSIMTLSTMTLKYHT